MKQIDLRAFAYCEHCGTSINIYKTDLKTFDESRMFIDKYLSNILQKNITATKVNVKGIVMNECTITQTMQLMQEFMIQLQGSGKEPVVNQTGSQTYIVNDEICALDLIMDSNVWYTTIDGKGWAKSVPGQKVEKKNKEKQSFINTALSVIGFNKS